MTEEWFPDKVVNEKGQLCPALPSPPVGNLKAEALISFLCSALLGNMLWLMYMYVERCQMPMEIGMKWNSMCVAAQRVVQVWLEEAAMVATCFLLLPAALGNMRVWLFGIEHCQMPMETGMRCNGM